jgi:LacI family transcriptional regulator
MLLAPTRKRFPVDGRTSLRLTPKAGQGASAIERDRARHICAVSGIGVSDAVGHEARCGREVRHTRMMVRQPEPEPRRDRRVGIRDVASRAGVGLATASRVLSGRPNVNADMRRRVLAAAEELGYQPDMLAQSLRRGATRSAGFVADDLSNHLIADIATGAEGRLRAEGYSLLVMNSEMEPELDALNVRVLRARRVDALMMCPVIEDDARLVRELHAFGAPLVDVEGDLPSEVPASYVHSDHRAGVTMALRDLIGRGHRRIAMIAGPSAFRSARQRRVAAEDIRREARDGVRVVHVEAELTPVGGVAAARPLLGSSEPPTAIVVGGWQLLVGVLEVVRAHGLRLGRDLSLVASDPPPLAAVFDPPLAAITRDAPGLGVTAAELLLARLRDPGLAPEQVMLPTTYRPAASVGPPRDSGPR